MGIFKRAAAIGIAAALTASMGMTAYAQDVSTDTERALIFTVENCGIAEGYEDEAKAIFNYFAVVYGHLRITTSVIPAKYDLYRLSKINVLVARRWIRAAA